MWVFGCAWKINFLEILFSWPCVLVGLTWKWFEVKIFTSNHFQTHAQKEREIAPRSRHEPRAQSPSTSPFDFDFELHPDRTLRLRQRTQSLEPFDFAPFNFAIRLRLWIAPRSHPSTSPTNPEPRSRLRLRRDHTPRSHQDGTDRIDRTEIAIEKWLGFDEFDRIWWIFFGWVLFLCLFIEKLYYKFVWKLRKCEEQIIFWNATKHLKIFPFPKIAFPENILHEPNTA